MFRTAALYCLILYLFITYNTEMFSKVRNIYVDDSFLTLFMHMFMHEILKSFPDYCIDFNICSTFMVSYSVYTNMMIQMFTGRILVIDG